MLFVILIITGRFSFHIGANQRQFSVPFLFGFQAGGTYSIDIKNCNETDDFIFIIATEKDIDKYMTEQNLYHPCKVSIPIDYYNITNRNETSLKINGTIKQTGKYNTTVLSCEYFHEEISFELIYNNPNSCLSYNVQNTLIINPIITLISTLLFVIWIINWIKYFTLKNIIHTLFSISFLFFVLQKVFFSLETIERNKSDESSYYQSYCDLCQLFSASYIFSSFLTIENQFFLNQNQKARFLILFLNLILSYSLSKCLLKVEYFVDNSAGDNDGFDFETVIIIFLWETALVFPTVLTYICNADIMKFRFTIQIFLISILYVLFYTFYSVMNTFLFDYYIVLLIDVINIAFLGYLGYIFRLNSETRKNYLRLQFEEIDDDDNRLQV